MDKITGKEYRIVNDLSNIEKPHPLETYKPYQKFTRSITIKDHNYAYTTALQNLIVGFVLNPLVRVKTILQINPKNTLHDIFPKSRIDRLFFLFRGNFQNCLITIITTNFNYLYRPLLFSYFNSAHPSSESKNEYFSQLFLTLFCSNFLVGSVTYPLDRWRTLVYLKHSTADKGFFNNSFTQMYLNEGVRGLWKGFRLMAILSFIQSGIFTSTFAFLRIKYQCNQEIALIASVFLAGTITYPLDTQLKKIQSEAFRLRDKLKLRYKPRQTLRNLLNYPLKNSFAGYSIFLLSNSLIFTTMGINSLFIENY